MNEINANEQGFHQKELSKTRDYLFDNIKFFLITLVVFGHFIESYITQNIYQKVIFICIYSFHIPLFVFLSGYFSKSANSLSIRNNIKTY
ncbi:acyltransferase family protein [Mucilaginibacter sp. Bleaf8]|nr:acyltransferase family protein [Mucilaginibacter sp. Bleaf8]